MSVHPALALLARLCAPDRAHVDLAAGGRAGGPGARSRIRPSRASSLHHGHDRAAGQGGPRHRHRPAHRARAARRLGAVVRTDCRRAMGDRLVARGRVGGVRRRVCRRDCRSSPTVQAAEPGSDAAGPRRRRPPLGLHRCDRRRARLPARLLDGRLDPSRLARRLRRVAGRRAPTARRRHGCRRASASITCRSPIPARPGASWRTCRSSCRRARS